MDNGFIIFFLVFSAFIGLMATVRKRNRVEGSTVLENIHEMKKLIKDSGVIIVTTQTVPGKEIVKVMGHIVGRSSIPASSQYESEAAELDARLNLITEAMKQGANAILDTKLNTSSYEQQGSQWLVTNTSYTGTAVIIQ